MFKRIRGRGVVILALLGLIGMTPVGTASAQEVPPFYPTVTLSGYVSCDGNLVGWISATAGSPEADAYYGNAEIEILLDNDGRTIEEGLSLALPVNNHQFTYPGLELGRDYGLIADVWFGTALPPGDRLVVARTTAPASFCAHPIKPVPPTPVDNCRRSRDGWDIPVSDEVVYYAADRTKRALLPGFNRYTGTVVARPREGFVIDGTDSWSWEFSDGRCRPSRRS